jgi:hypothetical protein
VDLNRENVECQFEASKLTAAAGLEGVDAEHGRAQLDGGERLVAAVSRTGVVNQWEPLRLLRDAGAFARGVAGASDSSIRL